MSTFPGFPKETLTFFRDLAANNDREWFNAHKDDYLRFVQEPAQDFVAALGPRLQKISPSITFVPATTRGSIMRIYRDVRFSKDKSPYKTHQGIVFWDGPHAKMENPGYYFHMDAKQALLYGGLYMFSRSILAAFRNAVGKARLGPEIRAAIEAVRSAGDYEVDGERYKRVPRGFEPDHPEADLLIYKGIWSRSPVIPKKVLTSPSLLDLCEQHAQAMAPLHHAMVEVSLMV